jgi:hypothetical protein
MTKTWAGHLERMGEKRNAYRILVGKPEGKRPIVRPRRRWEDNIVAYKPLTKRWLCKQRPLLCNARNIHSRKDRTIWFTEPLLWNGSKQRLGKYVPSETNARNNIRAVFSMRSTPRSLLCNGAVNTPPRRLRGCVFCLVRAEELPWQLALQLSWGFSCGMLASGQRKLRNLHC